MAVKSEQEANTRQEGITEYSKGNGLFELERKILQDKLCINELKITKAMYCKVRRTP